MHSKAERNVAVPPVLVAMLAVLLGLPGSAWADDDPEAEELREEGVELEVEELEIEVDDHRVTVEYELDTSDYRKMRRQGISPWLGIWVESKIKSGPGSGGWNLWYAVPAVMADGATRMPDRLDLSRAHVVVRLLGISNGQVDDAGHGYLAGDSVYVAVEGNHEDDHDHASGDAMRARHVKLDHGSSVRESVELRLSHIGSLHQYDWFAPRYGFRRLRHCLKRQRLMSPAFERFLHRYGSDANRRESR